MVGDVVGGAHNFTSDRNAPPVVDVSNETDRSSSNAVKGLFQFLRNCTPL